MPKVTLTQEDILRGTLVDPGWYLAEIQGSEDKLSKDGQSENTFVSFKILASESGETKFAGVPVRSNFNEKAPGRWKPFLEALGQQVVAGKTFDIRGDSLRGKKMLIMIVNDVYEGRKLNKIEDYRPAGG